MKAILVWYVVVGCLFSLFSFGFVDPNFSISTHPLALSILNPLIHIVYKTPIIAATLYTLFVIIFFILYALIIRIKTLLTLKTYWKFLLLLSIIFFLSYPSLSHDIFNYILSAKVAYFYRENPYLVMPTELLGEPMLGFTRAANKLALYGPVWILATWIPYVLSFGNVLVALYTFKLLVITSYVTICILIYKMTKDVRRVLFFACNPLVIIETFVSGHNDTFMMALVLYGIYLCRSNQLFAQIAGWGFMTASVLVKGATIVLLPLFVFFRTLSDEKLFFWASVCSFGVFLLTPLREELYPWYAIWFLVFVSLLPMGKRSFIHGAAYMLSFGLMLRYLPWIATREYGGTGPMIRLFVTWVPLACYSFWYKIFVNKR
ncbi:MAG: hypothetical protein AAB937_00060 [Patescibacteria group bacterium]